jgi:methanogenic corrinoid protein MtbC1
MVDFIPNNTDEVNKLIEALIAVDRLATEHILVNAHGRTSLLSVTEELITPALEEISNRWSRGELSLSEVYMGSRLCEDSLKLLPTSRGPLQKNQSKLGIVALMDYHSLGKKIVISILRSAGFEIIDYGNGVAVDNVVGLVVQDKIDILFVSTLMLPSALAVGQLRSKFDGRRLNTRIVVGGAPFRFDDQLWKELGADAMGIGAADAVEIAKRFSRERLCG